MYENNRIYYVPVRSHKYNGIGDALELPPVVERTQPMNLHYPSRPEAVCLQTERGNMLWLQCSIRMEW